MLPLRLVLVVVAAYFISTYARSLRENENDAAVVSSNSLRCEWTTLIEYLECTIPYFEVVTAHLNRFSIHILMQLNQLHLTLLTPDI